MDRKYCRCCKEPLFILTDEERHLIAEMIVDKVNYGGSLEKISKYIELFKKISGEEMP